MFRYEKTASGNRDLIIDGFENGIAISPYKGIGNIRNLNTSYYPGVGYVNYARKACTITSTGQFFAGTHSTNVSGNTGWVFTAPVGTGSMGIPIQKASSPLGLNYILDNNGGVWKQDSVNSSSFTQIGSGTGRLTNGNKGLAYWNNYLWVFGTGLIEVCGDGTGDAGITSANWNLNNYNTGFATNSVTFTSAFATWSLLTLPYARQAFPKLKKGDPVTLTTTGALPAPLAINTTYYIADIINVGTDVNSSFAFALSTSAYNSQLRLTAIPVTGATTADLDGVWQGTTGSYKIVFSNGTERTVTLTNGVATFTFTALGADTYTNEVAVIIPITDDGSGVHTLRDNANPLPIGNATNLSSVALGSYPSSTRTILTYVNPRGVTVTGAWQEATGLWNIVMAGGQKVPALFTNGSTTINLQSPLSHLQYPNTTWGVELLDPTVTFYNPYVSKVDGSLLFCNGHLIGRINPSTDPNLTFAPSLDLTYSVNFGVTEIPNQYTDIVTGMTDLKATLVVTGKRDIYTWDYLSTTTTSPTPIGEDIKDIINILSNIYVLAGEKGNIYISNGYSNQLLYKMPDFISGVIDPVWSFGGLMNHRSRLYFQALASTKDGTPILAGIFSLHVSAATIQDDVASGLVMEAQNSFGLVPTTSEGRGVLIDNGSSSTDFDSYYSAWGCGLGGLSGIDYNDTTLWANFEPVIETDIIPTGTNLEAVTFGQVEFKTDRPLATDDYIRLSFRTSLSDTFTLIGTSSSLTLSEKFISDIRNSQWVQFKVEFACASSGSSFIPFREIRVHLV